MRTLFVIPLVLALSACGGEVARPVAGRPAPLPAYHKPPHGDSLVGVIGADAETLVRLFGTPRLDIREGDARKLQWSGTACILDAYLYPADHDQNDRARAVATYVDARRSDGRDVDRQACITALRKS